MVELESWVWTDTGTEPSQGDESYAGGEQPIAEYDNWFNWAISTDVHNLQAGLADLQDDLENFEGMEIHGNEWHSEDFATLDDLAAIEAMEEHGNEWHTVDYATDADLSDHVDSTSNPHLVSASQIGAMTASVANDTFVTRSGDTMTGALGIDSSLSVSQSVGIGGSVEADGASFTSSVDFNDNMAMGMRIENRTSDPSNPAPGRIWFRTDLPAD